MTDEKIRPSERLKSLEAKQRKQRDEAIKKEQAETDAKAKPHIEALQKYINEPDDISAYLTLHKDDRVLPVAVYEVYWDLVSETPNEADWNLWNDDDLELLNAVSNMDETVELPDVDTINKSDHPTVLMTLLILCRFMRREYKKLESKPTPGTIQYKGAGRNPKTGKLEVIPINGDLDSTADNHTLFKWGRVEKFLLTLQSDSEQLKYLINLRARFNRVPDSLQKLLSSEDFLRECEIEINRLKELVEIKRREDEAIDATFKRYQGMVIGNELDPNPVLKGSLNDSSNTYQDENQDEENDARQYKFNLSHKVHALLYLLKNAGVNINTQGGQAEVARFIKAVTGQSYQNIYTLVLNHGFDPKKNKETHKKELRRVRDKFYNLKSNLEKAAQNDLERLEQENNEKL